LVAVGQRVICERVEHQVRPPLITCDGTGIALIRRGKTDAEGQGRSAYLSRETVRWLKRWLENAKMLKEFSHHDLQWRVLPEAADETTNRLEPHLNIPSDPRTNKRDDSAETETMRRAVRIWSRTIDQPTQ
jgi:hypothetical protein